MLSGMMADRHDSERLRGFGDRQTDGQTFAIVESLPRLKTYFTSLKRDRYPYRLGRKGAIGEWTYVSYWEMHPIIYQLII